MITHKVNFLEAARQAKWIRRRGTRKVLCISETPSHFYSITRHDLLADDWEAACGPEPVKMGDSEMRFSLLEMDR